MVAMDTCQSATRGHPRQNPLGRGWIQDLIFCTREEGHHGKHQNWGKTDRYSWSADGGSSQRVPAAGWETPGYVCSKCGALEEWHYSNEPLDPSTCFSCDHWNQIIQGEHPHGHFIIDGHSYIANSTGDNGTRRAGMGYGGRRQIIRTFNGRTVITNDLWTQGEVPSQFRDVLPDNAEFV